MANDLKYQVERFKTHIENIAEHAESIVESLESGQAKDRQTALNIDAMIEMTFMAVRKLRAYSLRHFDIKQKDKQTEGEKAEK